MNSYKTASLMCHQCSKSLTGYFYCEACLAVRQPYNLPIALVSSTPCWQCLLETKRHLSVIVYRKNKISTVLSTHRLELCNSVCKQHHHLEETFWAKLGLWVCCTHQCFMPFAHCIGSFFLCKWVLGFLYYIMRFAFLSPMQYALLTARCIWSRWL